MSPEEIQQSHAPASPEAALDRLRQGNARFVGGAPAPKDSAARIGATATGQHPFAAVLGCIDSRVPLETVFDQGIGDIFSVRVAGNVVSPHVLGSLEFACAVSTSLVVVVLGHTDCGAVKGAISGVELDNLTELVQAITPAITSVPGDRDVKNAQYVDEVAEANVGLVLSQIRESSPVLASMESAGDLKLVGAMYDVSSGVVRFL